MTAPLHIGGVVLHGPVTDVLAARTDSFRLEDLYGLSGAALYEAMAVGDVTELREIVEAVAEIAPDDVLELAAGAGRITMPLLALRSSVTALDLSPHMIDILRRKAATLSVARASRLTVVQGDMSAFDLGRTFDAVVLGTTSISLLSQEGRAGLLASVMGHLRPGGAFLVSTSCSDATGPVDSVTEFALPNGAVFDMFIHFRQDGRLREVTIVPREPSTDETRVWHSAVTVIPPDDLLAELSGAGFVDLQTRSVEAARDTPAHLRDTLIIGRRPR